jgi:hypothetical protein
MSAASATQAAFVRWRDAELAAHYAAPCPDEVMNQLVDIESESFDALQALPVTTPEDMLLKLFPILLREMEPAANEHPLKPGESRAYGYDRMFYERLTADLREASPAIRAAIDAPNPYECREKAA